MKRFLSCSFINLFLLLILFSVTTSAQRKQRVRFAKNSSSATVKDFVRGYEFVDYIVGARGGQELTVKLSAPAIIPVFTVFLPNGGNLKDAAEQNEFSGTLPETGDYVVRVLMMSSAARRKNSNAACTLKISIK